MVGNEYPMTIGSRHRAAITWDEMEMKLREKSPDVWSEVDRLVAEMEQQ